MKQTFAQYLINSKLPKGLTVNEPLDSKKFNNLLKKVALEYEDQYPEVVTSLKRLGDKLATLEGISFGMDEIDTPNKKKRSEIIKKYKGTIEDNTKSLKDRLPAMMGLQKDLMAMDSDPKNKDAATEMVGSSMAGKVGQMMKLRTGPGLVGDHQGNIVPEVFTKSYAEGQDVLPFWLGAAEARKNLATSNLAVSSPGELNKVISNVMNRSIVSEEDCGTSRGIELFTKDEDIIGRYLARPSGNYIKNKLIDDDVQQNLLSKKIDKILVRSPQTCQSKDSTVCSKCMGLRPGNGKPYKIGDNAGMIASGVMSEPLTQMSLSAKHSTATAKEKNDLEGEKGFRSVVELSDNPRRQIICEVYGKVLRIRRAPQGGFLLTIRETRRVPERYIVRATPTPNYRFHWDYYVNPQLKINEDIKPEAEVYPGLELTDGTPNIQDIARLKGLGPARTMAANNMYQVYKNTGQKLSRVHFELLARNAHPYVKIEKAPPSFPFKRGETVEYNKFEEEAAKHRNQTKPLDEALGLTLMEGIADYTAGTIIDEQVIARLKKANVQRVKVTSEIEVSPATTPMTRVVNQQEDWMGALNHRHLKQQLKDAGGFGKRSTIHGYSPVTSFAYGLEMGSGDKGRY